MPQNPNPNGPENNNAGTGQGEGAAGGNAQGNNGPAGEGAGGDSRTFTQAELEKLIGERLARERTKYADYDDAKAKAAELDQIREAQKTEAERLQGQIQQANERAQKAERDLWIADAARKHKVPDDALEFLTGNSREEIEAKATKLAGLTKPSGDEGNNGGQGDGAPAGGTNGGGNRRPDPSQGAGSSGAGTTSVAAGRERYRARYGKNT